MSRYDSDPRVAGATMNRLRSRDPNAHRRGARWLVLLVMSAQAMAACTPTVRVEAPDKPIEINMNVNIKHEILVKVEKEVEAMFEDEEIF